MPDRPMSEPMPPVDAVAPVDGADAPLVIARNEVPDADAADVATSEDPYAGAVPPGYDWPTHGGYLGCLLGSIASVLVGAFLSTTLFAALSVSDVLPRWIVVLLTVVVFLACLVGIGRLGWYLGKRFLREYPQERATWGEHDDGETELDRPRTRVATHHPAPEDDVRATSDEATQRS